MSKSVSSVVAAMRDYFGMGASELIGEWKQLTEQDKADFAEMLRGEGYEFPDTAAKAA